MVADKFPPVLGGIQTFACHLAAGLPADRMVVVAPAAPGYRMITVWLPMAPSACVLALLVRRGHL